MHANVFLARGDAPFMMTQREEYCHGQFGVMTPKFPLNLNRFAVTIPKHTGGDKWSKYKAVGSSIKCSDDFGALDQPNDAISMRHVDTIERACRLKYHKTQAVAHYCCTKQQ